MSLPAFLTLAIAASAVATVAADWGRRRPAFYGLKPLTSGLLLLLLLLAPGPQPAPYHTAMIVAFAFCIAGDVALMFHGSRAFVAGLSAFLVGHLVMACLFWNSAPVSAQALLTLWPLALAALPYALFLAVKAGRLAPAVLAYFAAIAAMAGLALLRTGPQGGDAAALTALGAGLFLFSDAVLGWRRFVRPFALGQAATLLSYYAALWCLARGA